MTSFMSVNFFLSPLVEEGCEPRLCLGGRPRCLASRGGRHHHRDSARGLIDTFASRWFWFGRRDRSESRRDLYGLRDFMSKLTLCGLNVSYLRGSLV